MMPKLPKATNTKYMITELPVRCHTWGEVVKLIIKTTRPPRRH